jgi:hypothetical protein
VTATHDKAKKMEIVISRRVPFVSERSTPGFSITDPDKKKCQDLFLRIGYERRGSLLKSIGHERAI